MWQVCVRAIFVALFSRTRFVGFNFFGGGGQGRGGENKNLVQLSTGSGGSLSASPFLFCHLEQGYRSDSRASIGDWVSVSENRRNVGHFFFTWVTLQSFDSQKLIPAHNAILRHSMQLCVDSIIS